jgi:hypothetical protein
VVLGHLIISRVDGDIQRLQQHDAMVTLQGAINGGRTRIMEKCCYPGELIRVDEEPEGSGLFQAAQERPRRWWSTDRPIPPIGELSLALSPRNGRRSHSQNRVRKVRRRPPGVDDRCAETPIGGRHAGVPTERGAQLLRMFTERIRRAGLETAPERFIVNYETDHEVEQVPHLCLVLNGPAKGTLSCRAPVP